MKNRSEVVKAFMVAIATALITMLGAMLPELNDSIGKEWVLLVGYSIIFLASLGLLVLLASSFVNQYIDATEKQANDEVVMESVPTLIRFRSRTDIFTIGSDGGTTLTWLFEVEKGLRQGWKTFEFPIVTEARGFDDGPSGEEPAPSFPVRVANITVDGEDRTNSAVLMFEERRSLVATQRHLDYSRLSVPVRLEEGNSRATIEITLVFDQVGRASAKLDFAVVDVPYVTDNLRVEVHHADPDCTIALPINTSGSVDERPIQASLAMMGFTDSRETEIESEKLVADRGVLVWKTHAPKLGYRYRVGFRVIGEPAIDQPVRRSNGTAEMPRRNGSRPSPVFQL